MAVKTTKKIANRTGAIELDLIIRDDLGRPVKSNGVILRTQKRAEISQSPGPKATQLNALYKHYIAARDGSLAPVA